MKQFNKEPLVSVVTPAYNAEQYIHECIDSILAQTYTSWEYTIIDNCSTDCTFKIAHEYSLMDSRIRVQTNSQFLRVIENHNMALRQIAPHSKYCKIVAADDWLFSECLDKMVTLAEENPSVAIVGAYGLSGTKLHWWGLPYPSTVVPGHEICRATLLGGPYVFGAPTSVLYRADIVRSRNNFYNEFNLHSDTEACFEFLENNDFGFVHQVLTFSRQRDDSLSSYSEEFKTWFAGDLYSLIKYGPIYLNDSELNQRIHFLLKNYYLYLGQQIFRRHDKAFWKFHREKLVALGYPLSLLRLGAATCSYVFDLALNPKNTIEKLASRFI